MDVDAWKTGDRQRTLSRGEARGLMPMYDYEPSLSMDLDDHVSSTEGGSMIFFPDTPNSIPIKRDQEDQSAEELVAFDGIVEIHNNQEDDGVIHNNQENDEEIHKDQDDDEVIHNDQEEENDMSSEARALLPAPNSCPRSGINLRGRQSPTCDSSTSQTSSLRRTQSFDETPHQSSLEDYLCTCKYCPRALTIQRAFQLYGFALDHPHSEALLRVLRACANYDETIVEVDPILVLHAEKMLEELNLDENETFRLLVASHFKRL
ncbi:unnamed protein product [Peronospora belbahrii]|uniref:Uncharacterized protein n=1 Tax=Peronospora belbahrii TaxID=622444 RepID=A0AAU9L7I6_9STRA|nr:unnamed protein product [Peronospora belbahrii]